MENTPQALPEKASWLWRPNLIVFLSSACIMILELVAGRIIAPHVGVSLYTWTSVIGIVLAGISLGNYLGGRIADRWASPRLLGGIYLLADDADLESYWQSGYWKGAVEALGGEPRIESYKVIGMVDPASGERQVLV